MVKIYQTYKQCTLCINMLYGNFKSWHIYLEPLTQHRRMSFNLKFQNIRLFQECKYNWKSDFILKLAHSRFNQNYYRYVFQILF